MKFDNKPWHEIKEQVLKNDEYKFEGWYIELTDYEKCIFEDLKQLQEEIGFDNPIK